VKFEGHILGNQMDAHTLLLTICRRAEHEGYSYISTIIRKYIPQIRDKDIELGIGAIEVSDLSQKSKIESVGKLFIETRSGEWFKNDKKLISELIDSQKLDDIKCIFSSPNYPFDSTIKQIEKCGINVTISPINISCNISDTITFYYKKDEFDQTNDKAIYLKGSVGKKLARELKEEFIRQFSNSINLSIIQSRYKSFLIWMSNTPEVSKYIWDLIFEENLECWERIILYIYLFPLHIGGYPSIKEISRIFGGNKNLEKIIENLKKMNIIEYIFESNDEINLKLSDYSINNFIPRFMTSIFNNREILFNHTQIGKILTQFKLSWSDLGPDVGKRRISF
jgi:hypothetical protein